MTRRRNPAITREATIEAWLFVIALAISIWLFKTGNILVVIDWISSLGPLLASLVAGGMYSTFVTTPLAIAGFLGIAEETATSIWQIAIAGSVGAALVDLLLITWLRSPIAALIVRAVVGHDVHLFSARVRRSIFFQWGAGVIGCFLMAIPLPTDELGVVFFSASGLRARYIFPAIFLSNFLGILALVAAARAGA